MKTIDLAFEDYPDTFAVTVSPIPLSTFEKVGALFQKAVDGFVVDGSTDGIGVLIPEFVKVAHPTVKGKPAKLTDLDANLILALVQQWHVGVRSVPLPLLRASSATGTSPEQSTPPSS